MKGTRMDALRARAERKGRQPEFCLPDLDPGEYMVDVLFDLGPVRAVGMGDGPTDWDVLHPYAIAKALDAEDTDVLAAMCRSYYDAREAGKQPLAIAPVDQGEGKIS